MRSKIFLLLMLITPGILGIPTPLESDDSNVEHLVNNDVLPADENSVDSDLVANGVSKKLALVTLSLHMQIERMQTTVFQKM